MNLRSCRCIASHSPTSPSPFSPHGKFLYKVQQIYELKGLDTKEYKINILADAFRLSV
jgi:hypothetical protein